MLNGRSEYSYIIIIYSDAPLATKTSARLNQAYKSAACTGTDHFRSHGNARDLLLLGNASYSPSSVPRAPSLCASLFLSGFSKKIKWKQKRIRWWQDFSPFLCVLNISSAWAVKQEQYNHHRLKFALKFKAGRSACARSVDAWIRKACLERQTMEAELWHDSTFTSCFNTHTDKLWVFRVKRIFLGCTRCSHSDCHASVTARKSL